MDYKDFKAGHSKESFWFKAKINLIDILMKNALRNRKQLRILNVGAGTGDDLQILIKYGNCYVIDIDKDVLSVVDSKLCEEKKVSDICDLPYDDNFFDVVVSFDVFEHIKNDQKAISEVYRVLNKNGILIFTVPAFQFLFSSRDKALSHHRRYGIKSIRRLLEEFRIVRIFFWNSLLFLPLAMMRLLKRNASPQVENVVLPSWLNYLFYNLLEIDNMLIKRNYSMPVGLSIVGYGFK